jgi:hypothetical protein
MDIFEDIFKRRRPQKLRTVFRDSPVSFLTKRHKKIFIGALIFGLVSVIVSIVLVVLLIRWLWNVGTASVTTNPTVSSVVESTKQSARSLLPTVPSGAQDFIQNGVVDEAKVKETFESLPAATQDVWKKAVESSITQQLESATGASRDALEQLKNSVLAL